MSFANSLAYEYYFNTSFKSCQQFLILILKYFFVMLRKVIKSMTTAFERIKELADKQRISLNDLEDKLGISRNSLYGIKKANPKSDRLQQIADYFNVSTDYLLGRTENPNIAKNGDASAPLDLRDIAAQSMLFDGKPLTEEDIDFITAVLEAHLKNK